MKGQRQRFGITVAVTVTLILLACVAGFYYRSRGPLFGPAWRVKQDPLATAAIKDLLPSWDVVQAVSAKVNTILTEAVGMEGETTGEGIYDLLKQEGQTLIRFEIENLLRIETPDPDDPDYYYTAERLAWVTDGAVMYHYIAQHELRTATKSKYNPDEILQIAGKDLFDGLRRDNQLTLMPDEMLDGKAVFVIEAKPHDGDWTSFHYFEKKTGIRLKMVEKDQSGLDHLTITLSAITLSPRFEPDHFIYKVPEGVELVDNTK